MESDSSGTEWWNMRNLDMIFSALADPTRRAILARLRLGEASVGELAAPFALGLRTISKHIGVLEQAGLISRESQGQRRLSRLEPSALQNVDAWLDEYRGIWIERHANIDKLLSDIRKGKKQ